MIRRSATSGDQYAASTRDTRDRPLPMRVAGVALLIGAVPLILGGAYREQANMISSGLLFLSMGVVFAPGVVRMGWPVKLALGALAIIGLSYALMT